MSDSSRRSRRRRVRTLALLLVAAVLLPCAGCPSAARLGPFAPEEEDLLRVKADEPLRDLVRRGGDERFAAVAVFRDAAFLRHSDAIARASILILDEFGNAAILLLQPGKVLPLLKDPSVRRVAWLGPQGRLARLDPALEFDLLSRFAAGNEGRDIDIVLRFKEPPGDVDERFVAASGFRVVTRVARNWIVSGPLSALPLLLRSDRIIYLEGASKVRSMPR
ncbi:MAG: hypothetical protein HZB86_08145 [Deltaproteobacteria bacterium]|nr:hypothetical protein [Deltaproteobacteria bacterium]